MPSPAPSPRVSPRAGHRRGAALAASPPALAHGDHDKDGQRAERLRTPTPMARASLWSTATTSGSRDLPWETEGISGCFLKSAPLFVMSSLDSLSVFDVSTPASPRLVVEPAQPRLRERGHQLRRTPGP